jgi:hypothetical protein
LDFIFFKSRITRFVVKIAIEYPIALIAAFVLTIVVLYQFTSSTYVDDYVVYKGDIEAGSAEIYTRINAETLPVTASEALWSREGSDYHYSGKLLYSHAGSHMVILASGDCKEAFPDENYMGKPIVIKVPVKIKLFDRIIKQKTPFALSIH